MNRLGPIVSATHVRAALKSTVEAWMPSYLAEVAFQTGHARGYLPNIASFRFSAKGIVTWPGDMLPACVIIVPGLSKNPRHHGDGDYDAHFSAGVGFVVTGKDQESTNENLELYVAAARALLLQHPSLGGFASGSDWVDERYDELSGDKKRTLAAGIVNIEVAVNAVLNSQLGLRTPPVDPNADPGNVPAVATAGVDEI